MKVVYLKDRSYRPAYIKKTAELLPYDLGDLLIGALERELSEPLDSPQFDDVPDDVKQRFKETM